MAKYGPNCCCDRTGLCTTRWYPLQGVTYFGNPDDCYVGDHGSNTFRVAVTEDSGGWKTWVTGNDQISKFDLPDGADPIKIWTKYFFYSPPPNAIGDDTGPARLQILEMKSVNSGNTHQLVIGTVCETALSDPDRHYQYEFPGGILRPDRSPYVGYNGFGINPSLTAADVASKFDIGYRQFQNDVYYGDQAVQTSTGGFFRMTVTQWLGEYPCGTAGFWDLPIAGTVEWTNPNGALETSGDVATATGENEDSHFLYGNFYFGDCLENFQSMTSVTVAVRRFASYDSPAVWVKDQSLRLYLDSSYLNPSPTDAADKGAKWPTFAATAIYGGDLWGFGAMQDWDLIGVALQVTFGNGVDAYVDQVSVTCDYLDTDGNPQTATINDILSLSIQYESNGEADIFPSSVAWANHNLRYSRTVRGRGFYTYACEEVLPLDASGSDIAAVLQNYLDPRYTASGSGAISPTTDATITITHDGSMDDDIIIYHGPYAVYDGIGHWLVGVQILAYPQEAASLHMLNETGEIVWSKCGQQNIGTDYFFFNGLLGRRWLEKIIVDQAEQKIYTRGGYFWAFNKFDYSGTAEDLGAYVGSQANYLYSDSRSWKIIDTQGYAYSQENDLSLVRYGPSGQEATYAVNWSVQLPFGITSWDVTDDAVVVAGTNTEENTVQVALVTTSGVLGWISEVPRNGVYSGYTQHQAHDVWINSSKLWVLVSSGAGCYKFHYATGVLESYFPHGRKCNSAVILSDPAGDDWLVLTGNTAAVVIDPADYDIDPETLT